MAICESQEQMWQHMGALAQERHARRCQIHWRFTCKDARAHMHDLSPSPKSNWTDCEQTGFASTLFDSVSDNQCGMFGVGSTWNLIGGAVQ